MKNIFRAIAIFLLIAATIQWFGVGERIHHAFWQWYKFKDYGGGGNTTISYFSVILTYLLSIAFIITSYILFKNYSYDKLIRYSVSISGASLFLGIISFSLLIVSPLSQVVSR